MPGTSTSFSGAFGDGAEREELRDGELGVKPLGVLGLSGDCMPLWGAGGEVTIALRFVCLRSVECVRGRLTALPVSACGPICCGHYAVVSGAVLLS